MKSYYFILLILITPLAFAQTRESVYNNIGWYAYNGDHKLSEKWSIHTEYQWRRTNYITNWQQSLARFGINYNLNTQAMLTFGYAQAQTFSYGDKPVVPVLNDGSNETQSFPEHRLYQDLVLKNNTGIFEISHRLKIEERWLNNYFDSKNQNVLIPDKWKFMMRFRYRFRVAVPLQGKTIDDNEFYLHAFDEILIGAGELVGMNIFDQNRLQIGLGYKLNKNCKFEAGYFQQIAQKPRFHLGNPVFEYNNGFLLGLFYNFDMSAMFKKKETAIETKP
jgi:hypothetical protein